MAGKTPIMAREIAEHLRNNGHFDALGDGAIDDFAGKASIVTINANQTIFIRDDQADALYLLLDGDIAIEIASSNGRTIRVATLGAGDLFGELAVLDRGLRTADARALTKARLIRIQYNAYHELLAANKDFAMQIIRDLVNKIRDTDIQIEQLSLKTVRQRLSFLLLELHSPNDGAEDAIKITQSEIADRLSASREKVNAHLQDLSKIGAIEVSRGKVVVRDTGLLHANC